MNPFDYLNAIAALEKPDGVIAFPTDTVYGLGCLPGHPAAIEKIYAMKGREAAKPLILMGPSLDAFRPFMGTLSLLQADRLHELVHRHWPGALTLIVPKASRVSPVMTGHLETVGLRVPQCEVLQGFFQLVPGHVLATTSANRSGEAECDNPGMLFKTFGSQLDALLATGVSPSGQASTVASIEPDGRLNILRPGAIMLD